MESRCWKMLYAEGVSAHYTSIKPNYTCTKTQIKHLKTPKPKRQTFKTLQTKENKGPRNPGISCLGGALWTAMSWS